MRIVFADLNDPQTQDLIAVHQQEMLSASPPGTSFALDLSGLTDPAVTVWTAWQADNLAGIGALKLLGADQGEIKSMRTAPDFLRRGVAALLLETIIDHARERRLTRLSLETGSGPKFEPALALYRRRGFENGPAFANYAITEFNQCLHFTL